MMKTGESNADTLGYSVPRNASLFPKPPFHYRGVESMTLYYETDEDAARTLLPEGLELYTPATVRLSLFKAPLTSLGPYNAAMVVLHCLWQGQPKAYVCYQIVTGDAAMAAGREIWGYPKKLGHVDFTKEHQVLTATVERPRNVRLCTATIRPEAPVGENAPAPIPPQGPTVCLKVVPSPVEGEGPALVQLVESGGSGTIIEHWQGPGSIQFDHPSPTDPWYQLGVKRITAAYYTIANSVLTLGSILKTY